MNVDRHRCVSRSPARWAADTAWRPVARAAGAAPFQDRHRLDIGRRSRHLEFERFPARAGARSGSLGLGGDRRPHDRERCRLTAKQLELQRGLMHEHPEPIAHGRA